MIFKYEKLPPSLRREIEAAAESSTELTTMTGEVFYESVLSCTSGTKNVAAAFGVELSMVEQIIKLNK